MYSLHTRILARYIYIYTLHLRILVIIIVTINSDYSEVQFIVALLLISFYLFSFKDDIGSRRNGKLFDMLKDYFFNYAEEFGRIISK